MKVMSARRIQEISTDPARCTRPFRMSPIDLSRPFIHEDFTPLYHTPLYNRLSDAQRLRYNQLSGMKVNEQFMLLERDLTDRILARLHRHPALAKRADIIACLSTMMKEEQCHHDMFRDLNQACLPEIYAHTDRYFSKLGRLEELSIRLATSMYQHLTCLLWFLLAVEEYSVGLSRAMMRSSQTETLGMLEPTFQRVHAEHVKDEIRHVHVEAQLVEACFFSSGKISRRVNAYLFDVLMKYVATPHAAGCVISHLATEYPELVPMKGALTASVLSLKHDKAFHQTVFNRCLMPHTFALLDTLPELQFVSRRAQASRS
jgi:P-aminobenzoate N-oxygenase AurF